MANRITFDPTEGPTPEAMAAEQAALEQGEKLISAQEQDRQRMYDEADAANEDVSLIGGKFKSQEDLLKAYNELQKKLGQEASEEEEDTEEEQPEASEEVAEEVEETTEVVTQAVDYMTQLGKEFDESGVVSDEAIEKLSSMDSKDLVTAYLKYNANAQAATLQQSQVNDIMATVGGAEAYTEMVSWAGQNLPAEEVADFNAVTATNNPVAIKFAVQALSAKWKGAEGYEAPLVTGRKAPSKSKAFRSQAELARAIADPRYSSDPAYRMDVEQKLARSGDLL